MKENSLIYVRSWTNYFNKVRFVMHARPLTLDNTLRGDNNGFIPAGWILEQHLANGRPIGITRTFVGGVAESDLASSACIPHAPCEEGDSSTVGDLEDSLTDGTDSFNESTQEFEPTRKRRRVDDEDWIEGGEEEDENWVYHLQDLKEVWTEFKVAFNLNVYDEDQEWIGPLCTFVKKRFEEAKAKYPYENGV